MIVNSTITQQQKMNALQWRMVLLCVWLNVIDGIDVMVMAFTASAIAGEWSLSGTSLGWLISIGLIGMTIGAIWLAPYGDRWGRRPMLIFCLILCGVCMALIAWCQTAWELGVCRFVAGIGIGGILASSNVLSNEYASSRNKGLAVSLLSVGYALGATIGGIVSLQLVNAYGWRSVFVFGGLLTLFTAVVTWKYLCESIAFLRQHKDPKSVQKLQRILHALPESNVQAMLTEEPATSKHALLDIMRNGKAKQTIYLWLAIGLTMFGFQFVWSWTPKLITQSGFSAESGMSAGIILSIGGIFGAIAMGFASRYIKLSKLQTIFLAGTAISTFLFMFTLNAPAWLFIVGLILGILINGSVASLYSLAPMLYPSQLRTTGVGFAMGMGRIAGIFSPIIAGVLLDKGWTPGHLYMFYAIAFAIALFAIYQLAKITHK